MADYANLTAPAPKVKAHGGAVCRMSASSPALEASARPVAQSVGLLRAPSAWLTARMGGSARLAGPAAQVSAAATAPGVLRAALLAPSAVVAAGMTVGVAGGTRVPLRCAAPIVAARSGAAPVRLMPAAGRVSARGVTGKSLRAALTAPCPMVTAMARTHGLSFAHLVAPALRPVPSLRAALRAPRPIVSASGSLVAVLEFEAYAINLRSVVDGGGYEVTRYTSFPFSNVVRAHGTYFGVGQDGLYRLTGSTDDGEPTRWEFQTGATDFGTPQLKHVAHAYLAGRLPPTSRFAVVCGEKQDERYIYSNPRGDAAQTYRCLFGRGLRARYYAFGVSGTGPLEVSEMEFGVFSSTRRI